MHLESLDRRGWALLEEALRASTLREARSVLPYARAEIRLLRVSPGRLAPTANYVKQDGLERAVELRNLLLESESLDIFELGEIVDLTLAPGIMQPIAPPIVEFESIESGSWETSELVLVDGLHRCYTALALGIEEVTVVAISGHDFPVAKTVARTLPWDAVKRMDDVPPIKRELIASGPQELRNLYPDLASEITEQNWRTFFYRDLGRLGSSGPRS
jgi:hypothetical protein